MIDIKKEVPREIMFANDLALTEESGHEVNELCERCICAMKLKGLKVNMGKQS